MIRNLPYFCLLFAVGSCAGYASSIATAAGEYYTGTPFTGGIISPGLFYTTTSANSSAPAASGVVTSTFGRSVGGLSFDAIATAGLTTQYDPYLRIFGSVSAGTGSVGGFASMSASLSDTLTVTSGPASGTLVFTYMLSGSAFSTQGFGPSTREEGDGINVSLNGTDPIPLPTIPGQTSMTISERGSFSVPYSSRSGSYTLSLKGMAACSHSGSCASSLNLVHTLNIIGLEVLNGSGDPVPTAVVTSQSGLNYLDLPGTIDTPVPEPGFGVAVLLFLGLVPLIRRIKN